MSLEISDIDFTIPSFLIHHFYATGTVAVLINLFVFYLIIFRNEKMDSFRYYMLVFQIACFLVDIHVSFAMQPVPLFPIRAGHCAGVFSTVLNFSSHILMTTLLLFVGFQVNALNICFLRKHQAITKMDNNVLSNVVYNLLFSTFLSYPFLFTSSFYFSKIPKKEQFRIIEQEYPIFRSQFELLPEFDLYSMNIPLLSFFLLAIGGCLQSTATVSFFVFRMYSTLLRCRNSLSRTTLEKHRSALKSLVAQFLTTPIAILPGMLIISTILIPFDGAQVFTWYNLMAMSTHSTINSLVVIFTFPQFRAFVLFWSKEGKRRRAMHSVSFVQDHSGTNRIL